MTFSYKESDMMDRTFLTMVLSMKDYCITIFKIVFDIKTIYTEYPIVSKYITLTHLSLF